MLIIMDSINKANEEDDTGPGSNLILNNCNFKVKPNSNNTVNRNIMEVIIVILNYEAM